MNNFTSRAMLFNFIEVPEGFLYRPPNPWIFGKTQHYIVSAAQRLEIEALLAPKSSPSMRFVSWFLGLVVALSVVGLIGTRAPVQALVSDYPATVTAVMMSTMALVAFIILHMMIRKQRAGIQSVLSHATPTERLITLAEIEVASTTPHSADASFYSALLLCALAAASAIFGGYMAWGGSDLSFSYVMNAFMFSFAGTALSSAWARRSSRPKLAIQLGRLTVALAVSALVVGGWLVISSIRAEFSDVAQARRSMNRGDHQGVIASLTKVVAADPKNRAAYSDRAKSFEATGKLDLAIEDYTKAIAIKPTFYDMVYRAILYQRRDNYDLAIADCTKAIELGSLSDSAYVVRAIAHQSKNERALALADYSKAIEINPKNISSFSSRASLYMLAGQKELALEDYRKILELPGSGPRDEKEKDNARNAIGKLTAPAK